MKRRTQADWHNLFTEQASSGQTATAFCRERGLSPTYFSLRRKRWLEQDAANAVPAFVPVAQVPQTAGGRLALQLGGTLVLQMPETVSPVWLAMLLQQLRA